MGQKLLNVRVRPPRVAILINRDAKEAELLLAFEFFSKIWGGRFGQILAVDSKACDSLTEFRLGTSRPEYIYGIDLDDKHWHMAMANCCQPRRYEPLDPDYVRDLKRRSPRSKDYYRVDHALIHLFETRDERSRRKQTLRLVTPGVETPLAAYCAATFGMHHKDLRTDLFDVATPFDGTSTATFVELMTEFVKEWQQSWLDVTAHKLISQNLEWGPLAPTVVLVGSKVPDLALFWNLRTASDASYPAWIIPIPAESMIDGAVVEALKEWLLAFLPYGVRPNYCQVTSQTVDESSCRSFASHFQQALTGSPIEFVAFQSPQNRLPVVVAYEYDITWPVEITGRKLSILPPCPKAFEAFESQSWILDLLKDVKTGRAVKELQLPPSPVLSELLNGACPPTFAGFTLFPSVGDGMDSINLRCSKSKDVVNIYLPTSEEILEEILHEQGIEPIRDEKRSSYVPVIKRFGGLYHAARAFSGPSGTILATLTKKTMTPSEIKGACKLGGEDLAGEDFMKRNAFLLEMGSDRMKRISRRRFMEYAKHDEPENLQLRTLLEYLADREILSRHWKIGPCRQCNQQYFVPRINIQQRIVCTNCGHRISLPTQVPIGYTLHRAVSHAIQEGIIPVAQTAQFLRGMTNKGFLWVPGVKYRRGEKNGDIDLIACCDGHLVFCECKHLKETPVDATIWEEVVDQFLETAKLAKLCKASLTVLASRTPSYPQAVIDRVKSELGTSIPHLLLDRNDLENGYRSAQGGWHLTLNQLLPMPFPERQGEPSTKPRQIQFGWGQYFE